MKNVAKIFGLIVANGLIIAIGVIFSVLFSCKDNGGSSYTRCEDSLAMYTKAQAPKDTGLSRTGDSVAAGTIPPNGEKGAEKNVTAGGSYRNTAVSGGRQADENNAAREGEPTGRGTLTVTSSAFANMSVIPVKYTCDGQGATPPLKVTNIPDGTKSLSIIVYDYNATPEGGMTYWIIWNIDPYSDIPEDFHNNHETMNQAGQYGNTPLCAQHGDHKYHFIVYALDTKLVIGKNTTKRSIENIMKGHILAKGEIVGVYNRHLE
jgi:Raf kinase inhibitor-like YbhB/YbcL family protein